MLLINEGLDINATQEEKYQFVIEIASGKSKYEEIITWLNAHTIKNSA
jgi:death-on-curing protein